MNFRPFAPEANALPLDQMAGRKQKYIKIEVFYQTEFLTQGFLFLFGQFWQNLKLTLLPCLLRVKLKILKVETRLKYLLDFYNNFTACNKW